MKMQPKNKALDPSHVCNSRDPLAVRELLSKVGDKWSIFILLTLEKFPGYRARFSELERAIPGISQRMLTLTLRNLERDGLVRRTVFPEVPPRVDYELTRLGKTLLVPIQGLAEWAAEHRTSIQDARAAFDRDAKKKPAALR